MYVFDDNFEASFFSLCIEFGISIFELLHYIDIDYEDFGLNFDLLVAYDFHFKIASNNFF